jgi:hypothetical protein
MGYKFDDNDDEGIFDSPEKRGAGDKDAIFDMEQEGYVEPLVLNADEDGLPVPEIEDVGVLDDPPRVDSTNFLCLGGPCKHYTENLRLEASGPAPDAEDFLATGRWCGRLRTWAEPTDTTELNIFGCTSFVPIMDSTNPEAFKALQQNILEIQQMRAEAVQQDVDLGICIKGPCKNFVEMIVRTPADRYVPDKRESRRYCTRLAGLGRLYDLREKPVRACSAWNPIGLTPQLARIAIKNMMDLHQRREDFANRPADYDELGNEEI